MATKMFSPPTSASQSIGTPGRDGVRMICTPVDLPRYFWIIIEDSVLRLHEAVEHAVLEAC